MKTIGHWAGTALFGLCLLWSVAPQKTLGQGKATIWDGWKFLLGEWVGEGGGKPGQASAGEFTFSTDLQGAVIVRKSFAEYPASQGRPAFRHDDLMVIYPEADATKADYFDNEGHVIHYSATFSFNGDTLTFLSDPQAGAQRYRLSYIKTGETTVKIKFEIAPSDKPEEFGTYLEVAAHKK